MDPVVFFSGQVYFFLWAISEFSLMTGAQIRLDFVWISCVLRVIHVWGRVFVCFRVDFVCFRVFSYYFGHSEARWIRKTRREKNTGSR